MEDNGSSTVILTLSGIKELRPIYLFIFLSLFFYLLIILLNLILIITILSEKSLHEPMYLFVCNLCLNNLYGTTGFYPKLLYDLFSSTNVISFIGCCTQFLVIYTSFLCEYTTFAIMAYDRYVAICKPLQYHKLIVTQTVVKAVLWAWTFPFLLNVPFIVFYSQIKLCGIQIDRLYCYNWAMLKLACGQTTGFNIYGLVLIGIFAAHAVFIAASYQRLIAVCRKSKDNKKKFMQTCVPHLISLLNFTAALLFDTMFTRFGSVDLPLQLHYFLQVEILIIPPLLNPLMYGLKLTEVRKRLFLIHKHNTIRSS